MNRMKNLTLGLALTIAFGVWVSPGPALAQSTGNNTICLNPTSGATTCSNTSTKASWSAAYIDASPFASATTDICATLFSIINGSLAAGTVIDARGINSTNSKHDTTNQDLLCAGTPWVQGAMSTTHAATILLPAATIEVSKQWVLPNQTRIIGEGSDGSASGRTTIAACNSSSCSGIFTSNVAILKMGTGCPAAGCTGVAIEDLALNGNSVTGAIGITNAAAHELSYVRRVNLFNIPGTGLLLTTGASNSGPYSGITFTTSTSNSICASIQAGTSNTRGIQGLTCTGPTSSPFPSNAVLVNASNNTIDDLQVSGFLNGVTVGNSAAVQSIVLSNIKGGSHVTSVVHVSNTNAVTDLVVLGVVRNSATNAIQDQTLPTNHQLINDASVAMYVIGEKMGTTAYSRFTTSPNANLVTWSVGTSSLTVGSTCPATGSMYSNVGSSSGVGTTWYACTGGKWANVK
jgi:hypothetical protein